MMIATAILASLACAGICAALQNAAPPVFACNLQAIGAAERPRYRDLVNRVRAAMRERKELPDGYAFQLDSSVLTLPEAAEWISPERKCCPFLTLQLSTSGNQPDWLLTLTGPEGVKPLPDAEFPAR